MPSTDGSRVPLRVVASQMDLEDVSGRVLFPSPAQGPWLPLLRFAETTTMRRGDDSDAHTHEREEVLSYIVEGPVEYEDDAGRRTVLGSGAVALLTAPGSTRHNLMARPSPRSRWISVIVRCPPGGPRSSSMVQIANGPVPARTSAGTVERLLVGRGGAVASNAGLECTEIEFLSAGSCRCRVGSDRRAVAYGVDGTVRIDGASLEAGSGALFEDTAGVGIEGESGARVILASALR